jgi:NADH-quinone oxidoreductase subunit E
MSPSNELIVELANKHGRSRENLLPIIQGVVEKEKYLSEYSMIEIARELDIPASEVYGTATFYSFIGTKRMGEFIIRVCKTITCSMKGKNQILFAITDMLKIGVGETTADNRFSLL